MGGLKAFLGSGALINLMYGRQEAPAHDPLANRTTLPPSVRRFARRANTVQPYDLETKDPEVVREAQL